MPDPMKPAWSQALAIVCQSPYWRGLRGMLEREMFVERASQYATYDDLPRELKATYDKAYRMLKER